MPGGYLYGWNDAAGAWVKVQCNAIGEMQIDADLIFEDVPTDNELSKAPTSNWAYDHENDVAAHHVRYTDAEARTAIGDILDSDGKLISDLDCNYKELLNINDLWFKLNEAATYRGRMFCNATAAKFEIYTYQTGVGFGNTSIIIRRTDHTVYMLHEDNLQQYMSLYLEENPTNGEDKKAPTSNWAYDHDADADAHHVKYTDAEAQAACNLDGDLYLSIPGLAFRPTNPDTDQYHLSVNGKLTMDQDGVTVYCPVILPDGATVTACLVDGSAGLTDETWTLWRIAHSDQSTAFMGQAAGNTEDTSISNAVIDHSLYSYVISLTNMYTADELYYARLKYTL